MSRGMLLLAGLLAAAPVAAQSPEPAPMPKAKAQTKVELRFDLTPRGAAVGFGVGPTKPAPTPAACPSSTCVMETVAFANASAQARLSGTWYREIPSAVVAFHFAGDELTMTMKSNDGETSGTATLTADYAITKDGTVHGVFTGSDVVVNGDQADQAEIALMIQSLVDQPFAFRCKPTAGGMMISMVRLPDPKGLMKDAGALVCGKYTFSAKGEIPTAKANANAVRVMPSEEMLYGAIGAGCPRISGATAVGPVPAAVTEFRLPGGPVVVGAPPVQRLGISNGACLPTVVAGPAAMPTFTVPGTVCPGGACPPPGVVARPAPMPTFTVPGTVCAGGACPPPGVVLSSGPPPEVHAMMLQAFGQMGAPSMPCPPPPMAMPAPAVAAWTTATAVQPAATLPVGTWTREIGPVTYKLEFKNGNLIATVTTLEDDGGKTVRVDHVLMADCYATRNPGELVGIVTGFDMAASGASVKKDDVLELLKVLPNIQKQLSGKPLALSFRVIDDSLVIGDVRLNMGRGEADEMLAVFAALGGKYRTASLPPRPQPVTGATLPSSHYFPQYVLDPPSPLTAETDSVPLPASRNLPRLPRLVPAGPECERIGVDFNFNPPRRIGLPPMPEPAPLPKANPFRNGGN